ncbi:MAG: hypothetical protein WA790_05015 [Sulfitobacter sp.]
MMIASSKVGMYFAAITFPFLDGVLRGTTAMSRVPRMVLIGCCAALGLMALIILWPIFERVRGGNTSSLQMADFLSVKYILYVVIFIGATAVAQILGIYLGRRLTAFVSRGDTR